MPLCELNFEANTCEVSHLLNDQISNRSLVNGAAILHARRTNDNSKVDSLDLLKPPCLMNGYDHHGYQSRRAAPPKNKGRQKSTFSPVVNASAAGRVKNVGVLGAIATSGDDVQLCDKSEQVVPDPSSLASKKNPRRKKNFRYREKRKEGSAPVSMPQQELEDWEEESQEVEVNNWEKMCFGIKPYGPEDVIHFELRDLTLQQGFIMNPLGMDSYCPGKRHVLPIKWTCYKRPYEPGQFADAEF